MLKADFVMKSGAVLLRGCIQASNLAYAFQGLKKEGLKYLKSVGQTGMPVVSECGSRIGMAYRYVDMFQIGSRNMQFCLLKEVGRTDRLCF